MLQLAFSLAPPFTAILVDDTSRLHERRKTRFDFSNA